MRAVVGYGLACAALVAATVLLLSPWLDAGRSSGLAMAGGLALGLQVVAFGLLVWSRERTNRFLAVWIGGTVVRFAAIGLAAWVIVRRGEPDPLATLLGLAGFLFGMLLLEPVFFGAASGTETSRVRA